MQKREQILLLGGMSNLCPDIVEEQDNQMAETENVGWWLRGRIERNGGK